MAFDGGSSSARRCEKEPKVIACLMRNLYRNANGRAEDDLDPQRINVLVQSLAARNYV